MKIQSQQCIELPIPRDDIVRVEMTSKIMDRQKWLYLGIEIISLLRMIIL